MKTYLFDFDGTLVDSMPTFSSVMLKILDEFNIKYEPDIVKIITPLGYEGTAKYFRTLGIGLSVEELLKKMNSYASKEYAENIPLKPHVKDALIRLKNKGDSLNILTASPHSMLDVCLKRVGVYDLFTNVWSCDDFALTKANPEIYKLAAKKLGKNTEDIIFLDDNLTALKTAKLSGMKVYGVYDASSIDYAEEIRCIADKYLEDFSNL